MYKTKKFPKTRSCWRVGQPVLTGIGRLMGPFGADSTTGFRNIKSRGRCGWCGWGSWSSPGGPVRE